MGDFSLGGGGPHPNFRFTCPRGQVLGSITANVFNERVGVSNLDQLQFACKPLPGVNMASLAEDDLSGCDDALSRAGKAMGATADKCALDFVTA